MTIPGPVFVVGLPLAVSLLLQLLRRWTAFMAWIAAGTAALVGLSIALSPLNETLVYQEFGVVLGQPLYLMGRELVVEPVDRLPLAFIFLTAAGLFVIAWRLLPHSNFFPNGLTMTALLAAALLVKQVVYAALLVEMAAILAVFPLHEPLSSRDRPQPKPAGPDDDTVPMETPSAVVSTEMGRTSTLLGAGHVGRVKGGLRYLTYATLALPGLMVTQLLLEWFSLFPNDRGVLQSATLLLALSFAILLGAAPFQSWLSTVATDGSPPVVTFLFTVNIGTVWFMLLAYLEAYTWLGAQALFGPLISGVGLLMMVLGGALSASQRHLGRLVAYATLVDNGAMFVALGTRQAAGVALSVMMLIARPLALGLMTIGLDGLRRMGGGDDSEAAMSGLAWESPWRAVAFIMGGVAMAGFPLSLGFPARWGLFRLMVNDSFFQAILALSGSAGVMMGVIGAIRILLTQTPLHQRAPYRDDVIVLILIVVLIAATLWLGLFPQNLSSLALQMTEGFTFLRP